MEEQYPLWLLLHLFLDLWAKNGNKDVPIRYYFRFSHAIHLLQAFFKSVFTAYNKQPSFPPSHSYCHPLRKLLPIAFRWHFIGSFLRTCSWHHRKSEKLKNTSWNKMLINFYIRQWTVNNARTNTMVTPCQKNCTTRFNIFYRLI